MPENVVSSLLGFGQLSAFLVALYFFLHHLKSRDEDMKIKDLQQIDAHRACEEAIARIAAENKQLAERCLIAFDKNTAVLSRVEAQLERASA